MHLAPFADWCRGPLALAAALAGCIGCAHHRADPYAYAPPLAPPVYPQPQPPTQPVVYPAPPGTLPATVPAAPGPMAAAAAPAVECCPPLGEGAVVATPVVYESDQTAPCPPGP